MCSLLRLRANRLEVGHAGMVKEKLCELLATERVPLTTMHHEALRFSQSMDEEGITFDSCFYVSLFLFLY